MIRTAVFAGVVSALVVGVLTWLWQSPSGSAARERNGDLTLRYGTRIRTFPAVMAAIWTLLLTILCATDPPRTSGDAVSMAAVSLFLSAVIVGLALEFCGTRVRITEAGMTRTSPWSKDVTLAWDEIESIGGDALQCVVAARHRKVTVSRLMDGIADLDAALERHKKRPPKPAA